MFHIPLSQFALYIARVPPTRPRNLSHPSRPFVHPSRWRAPPTLLLLRLSPSTTRHTAPNGCCTNEVFRVTHPFHPLFGQEFRLLFSRCCSGEDYLFFQSKQNRDNRIPTRWTSLKPPDSYVVIAGGRSLFRPTDLLDLVQLVRDVTVTAKRARRRRTKKGL